MKKYLIILFVLCLLGCGRKQCKSWYSYFHLYPVTKSITNNEKFGDWYQTDFFNQELNFYIQYISSQDGYEECKSVTMIHEILNDSTKIYCSNDVIINQDTIKSNVNLKKYFITIDPKGSTLFSYDKLNYNFPLFTKSYNTFKLQIKLSDNTIMTDSCIVKIY